MHTVISMTDDSRMTDIDLAAGVARGERSAAETFVSAYQVSVRSFCIHTIGSYTEGEDLSQEVFVRAFHSIAYYRGESSLKTWLLSIAKNMCIDAIRRKRSYAGKLLALAGLAESGSRLRPSGGIADMDLANKLLGKLSEEDRAMFVLHHLDEQDIKEISRIYSTTEDAVKSKLKRIRKRLLSEALKLECEV